MTTVALLGDLFEESKPAPNRKPLGEVEIDWPSPLAAGLAFCTLFNAVQPRDLVLRSRSIQASSEIIAADRPGLVGQASASNGYCELSPIVSFPGTDWTLSSLLSFPILSNFDAVVASNNSPYTFHLLRNSTNDRFASWLGGYTDFSPTVAPLSLSGWKRVTAVGTSAGVKIYLDGVETGSHGTALSAGIRYILGDGDSGGSLNRAIGSAADYFIWTRALSDVEVRAHAAQPYALLRAAGLFGFRSAGVTPANFLPPFPHREPSTQLRM